MEVRDFDEMSRPENGSVIIGKHFPPMMLIKKKNQCGIPQLHF